MTILSRIRDLFRRAESLKTRVEFDLHAKDVIAKRFGGAETATDTIPEPYRSAHKHSFRNRAEIKSSSRCGCFYCGGVFDASEICEWHDEGQTAFCPLCLIDAVLGDASGLPLTDEFLKKMNGYWFR